MNILFGSKEKFAIELGEYSYETKKGRLRFWIAGKSMGEFKKVHTLSYAVTSLKRIADLNNDLYDDSFKGKSDKEIFYTCLFIGKNRDEFTQEDYKKAENYQRFSFFFGDQLDDVTCLIFIKDMVMHFIWSVVTDYVSVDVDYFKNFNSEIVHISEFKKAVASFLLTIQADATPRFVSPRTMKKGKERLE